MILLLSYLLLWICCGAVANSDLSNASNCSCYSFFSWKRKSWSLAQEECIQNKGNLVSIETEREWQFVNAKIQKRNFSENEWWIGLWKDQGRWQWKSGSLLMINKWQKTVKEPNNDGDCAAMAKNYPAGTQGLFKDMQCNARRTFICEYDRKKAMCNNVSPSYFYCPNNESQQYEVSKPVYFNHTATRIVPTTKKSSSTTAPPLFSDKIGLLIFVVIFGFVLLVCTLTFIYVFCWCVYYPGYEGGGREDQQKLYRSIPSETASSSFSCNRSHRVQWYIDDNIQTESIELVEPKSSASPVDGLREQPENSMNMAAQQESEKCNELNEKTPVIYAEVHKSSSTARLLEDDAVVVAEEESSETAITKKETEKAPDDKANTDVYSNIHNIKTNSHKQASSGSRPVPLSRNRSNTAHTNVVLGGNSVTEDNCMSSRSQTWGTRSRDHTTDDGSAATWYTTNDAVTRADPNQTTSGKPNVIYATVDKSKKTKRQTNDGI